MASQSTYSHLDQVFPVRFEISQQTRTRAWPAVCHLIQYNKKIFAGKLSRLKANLQNHESFILPAVCTVRHIALN